MTVISKCNIKIDQEVLEVEIVEEKGDKITINTGVDLKKVDLVEAMTFHY